MSDKASIPKPVALPAGKTVQSYPLAPVDGFVLSRVDGMMTVGEIITITGLDDGTVQASIDKLVGLGLIECTSGRGPKIDGGAATKTVPQPEKKMPATMPPRPITEVSELSGTGAPKPKPALYDPAELDEDVDLDRDHRRRILDTFYRLADLDLYEVLGVERFADKKGIKRAYYELAAVHHPDRFFRKRLGSFKQKMEAVFSRVTEAHDTLVDKTRRADYDAYLFAQDEAKVLEAKLGRAASPGMDRIERAASAASSPEVFGPPPESRTSGIQLSEQARRDSLARKLLASRPAPRMSSPAPAPDPDALRRHYDERVAAVRDHLIKDHVQTAERAKSTSDWAGASNAYRLALQVQPDDAALQQALAEVQLKANAVLADSYRKQASYEEKAGHAADAARSWQRVAKLLPDDAEAHGHAASCMLRAGVDLRTAANLAQRAIALVPTKLEHRVVLAEIYLAAGHAANAKRELEAAARLAPGDANIEALLKRAGKH